MKPIVYMWGTGKYADIMFDMIILDACEFAGVIDRNADKEKLWKGKYLTFHINEIGQYNYDYIIVSIRQYQKINEDIEKFGLEKNKIICFWNMDEEVRVRKCGFINLMKYYQIPLWEEMKRQNDMLKARLENVPYEWGIYETPKIKPAEDLLKRIIAEKISLCRFGDGEFEMMRMKERPWFQKPESKLAEKLKEVLNSRKENIALAVADNFGNLEKYTEEAADGIRSYMTKDTREEIMQMIGMQSEYYDAYVTRPYIMYKNRKNADTIFPLFKELWKDRNIILVEGEYARNGIGNDLFQTAKNIRRILCPAKDSWGKYSDILKAVKKIAVKSDLICISLGPTATVMAYDLANEGFQAVDIGQVDNEYDWYVKSVRERTAISGKMVAEVSMRSIDECSDEKYVRQIVDKI